MNRPPSQVLVHPFIPSGGGEYIVSGSLTLRSSWHVKCSFLFKMSKNDVYCTSFSSNFKWDPLRSVLDQLKEMLGNDEVISQHPVIWLYIFK